MDRGRQALRDGRVAAFTVAGGDGSRLGWDGPKGTYPITPIKGHSLFRVFAEKIMRERGIAIDDQYAFALPRLKEIQREANVHFTPEGSERLAEQAVAAIETALADQ